MAGSARMAREMGIDPVEFRMKNAIKEGDTLPYGAHMNPTGIRDAIERVAKEIKWGVKEKSKDPKKAIGKAQGAIPALCRNLL